MLGHRPAAEESLSASQPFPRRRATHRRSSGALEAWGERSASLFAFLSKPDPDSDLVAAARCGDERAFNGLVRRHHERLIQFVRTRLDRTIDADDVAQEVFVAAWRQLPGFRGGSRFQTWLFGIAVKQCA